MLASNSETRLRAWRYVRRAPLSRAVLAADAPDGDPRRRISNIRSWGKRLSAKDLAGERKHSQGQPHSASRPRVSS